MENCLILKNQPIDFIVISSRDDPPLLLGRSVGVSLYIYIYSREMGTNNVF